MTQFQNPVIQASKKTETWGRCKSSIIENLEFSDLFKISDFEIRIWLPRWSEALPL